MDEYYKEIRASLKNFLLSNLFTVGDVTLVNNIPISHSIKVSSWERILNSIDDRFEKELGMK